MFRHEFSAILNSVTFNLSYATLWHSVAQLYIRKRRTHYTILYYATLWHKDTWVKSEHTWKVGHTYAKYTLVKVGHLVKVGNIGAQTSVSKNGS